MCRFRLEEGALRRRRRSRRAAGLVDLDDVRADDVHGIALHFGRNRLVDEIILRRDRILRADDRIAVGRVTGVRIRAILGLRNASAAAAVAQVRDVRRRRAPADEAEQALDGVLAFHRILADVVLLANHILDHVRRNGTVAAVVLVNRHATSGHRHEHADHHELLHLFVSFRFILQTRGHTPTRHNKEVYQIAAHPSTAAQYIKSPPDAPAELYICSELIYTHFQSA